VSASNIRIAAQSSKLNELISFQLYCSDSKIRTKIAGDSEASKLAEKIILLHNDDGRVIGSRTMQFAQELAKKRKMSLKKIESPTLKKDWYKLVPTLEFIKKDAPEKRPESKTLSFGVNIAEHDLKTKAKQVSKWISQGLEVRVTVTGNMNTSNEQLVNTLKQFRGVFEDVPHEITETKPKGGILRCVIRAPRSGPKEEEPAES